MPYLRGMRDAVSIQRLATLHPEVRQYFQSFIEEAEAGLNITIRITEALRTFDKQANLYAQGRTKPGKIVTNAKPGSSFHQYGLATDLVRINGKNVDWNYDMSKLVPYALKYGITWGGNFQTIKDKPHFEKVVLPIKTLRSKYQAKDFIPGGQYVNL